MKRELKMNKHWLLIKPFEGIQIVKISRLLITTTPKMQKMHTKKGFINEFRKRDKEIFDEVF